MPRKSDLVLELWGRWAERQPSQQRLYFEFHKRVIAEAPELEELAIHETLRILADHETALSKRTRDDREDSAGMPKAMLQLQATDGLR